MGYFYNQFVSGSQLAHNTAMSLPQDKSIVRTKVNEEGQSEHYYPWLSVADLIPNRNKEQSKLPKHANPPNCTEQEKIITRALIHAKDNE